MVCLSGGVPLEIPIVQEARRRGMPLSNDTQIFMELAPCKTVGITGSAGKTTTTALVGEMARLAFDKSDNQVAETSAAAAPGCIRRWQYRGSAAQSSGQHATRRPGNHGNLFVSAGADDHLAQMWQRFSTSRPITWIGIATMAAYTAAKARLLDFQREEDTAVLGRDDPGAWDLRDKVKGRLNSFGFSKTSEQAAMAPTTRTGFCICPSVVCKSRCCGASRFALRGDHNVLNALAAFAVGQAAGLPLDAMLVAARGIPGSASPAAIGTRAPRRGLVRRFHRDDPGARDGRHPRIR